MNRTSLAIDDSLNILINELKKRYVTNSTAYLVRLALTRLYENFLPQNVDTSTIVPLDYKQLHIPSLPGMTERVIRSQMDRFNLTADEYETIVRQVVDGFAASGSAIKNPEAAIFGACRRYAKKRDNQTEAADDGQPTEQTAKSVYDYQEEIG